MDFFLILTLILIVMRKRSKYRVVPTVHQKFGNCWAVKLGDVVDSVFITKAHADNRKAALDKSEFENYLLTKSVNQKLKIEN